MYVDEVYLGSLAGQTANLYDIQRVEVLRGPQGTLYGRNTTGGLVHFVTNKPTDSFEAYGQLTAGTFSQVKFEGALSGPFSERVRGRVAAFYDSDDGVQERDLGTGVKGNAKDIFSARALLDIDMSESWNLLLNVHGSRTRNDSQLYKFRGILDPVTGAPCDRATFETFACVDAFGNQDSNPALEVPFTLGFGRTPLDIDLFGTSATLNWESDQWSLISITGYESTEKFHRDTTGSFPPILLQPIFRIDAEQLTQELRLTNTSDNLVWLVGLFYFDDNKKGGNSLEGPPFPDNAAPLTYNIFHDQDTEALALFAHSDWNINDSWSLRVGVRYTNEDKSLVDDVDTDILFAPAPPFVFTDSISTDHISWNVGLNWQINDDSLLFTNISEGFKSGGWNSGGLIGDPAQLAPYRDETVLTYEVGLKSTFMDGRMRFNATAFYYDYEDFQAFTQAQVNGLPTSRLQNAGNAENTGFEIELYANPTDWFEAQVGIGSLDTETSDFFSVEDDGMGGTTVVDLSGTQMVYAPEFSANGLFRAYGELFGGDISAQVSFTHSDEYFYDSDNNDAAIGGDYTIWNARVGWRGGSADRYEIAAFVNNFTDELYIVEGFSIAAANQLMVNTQRTAGISFAIFVE